MGYNLTKSKLYLKNNLFDSVAIIEVIKFLKRFKLVSFHFTYDVFILVDRTDPTKFAAYGIYGRRYFLDGLVNYYYCYGLDTLVSRPFCGHILTDGRFQPATECGLCEATNI